MQPDVNMIPDQVVADSTAPVVQKRARDLATLHELKHLLGRESAKTKLRRLAGHGTSIPPFNPICSSTTLTACRTARETCDKAHYELITRPCTETSLGYCSYLNLCYGEPLFAKNPSLGEGSGPRGGMKECRYMHFQVAASSTRRSLPSRNEVSALPHVVRDRLLPKPPGAVEQDKGLAQWVNCDIRSFDYSVLGQFQVIVADPPWERYPHLPYGTMNDDEMRRLPLPSLQPDYGILALWVTGRAMELGRELFSLWGYRRVDELVWVKVNQLQRLIRTGRTGHWLKHVPRLRNGIDVDDARQSYLRTFAGGREAAREKGVDTDVVVGEVRETSRKPDEVYGVIERLAPHGRKLELFGRKHNTRPGWLTLGNQREQTATMFSGKDEGLTSMAQVGDSQIVEIDLHARLQERYPNQSFALVSS
ncbi:MAG: hypothetical protein TREMPRED_002272 [Tremellales sp. Tagirdzhanova-0007]|nr:MAG: hypothetical protein TREMPRED_002272 [Tremellales sp. Tagirdzhanova-0007]